MGEGVSKTSDPATSPASWLHSLSDEDIERFLHEDVPYGDLTTTLLEIGAQPGRMTFATRHETVICCTEEAARLLERVGCRVVSCEPSGTVLPAEQSLLVAEGEAGRLHAGWKVALNLLESASGIATRTKALMREAQAANPEIEVVATRKVFPGTKSVAVKAVYAGGAMPHRLGLSESILVFAHHASFLESDDELLRRLPELRRKAKEKKVSVEVTDRESALATAQAGAEILQIDKMGPEDLRSLVPLLREAAPTLVIAAAGGINETNAREYASTGVDLLVTSAMYWGKPADIAVTMEPTD